MLGTREEMSDTEDDNITAHEVSVEELVSQLGTNIQTGLTDEQAKANLEKYGPNVVDGVDPDLMAVVRRGGQRLDIKAADLTIGDIVLLEGNCTVPADVRIVESNGYEIDQSMLTGDSGPQPRGVDKTHDNPMESQNLAWYYRSYTVSGSAVGVVYQVGKRTIWGRVSHLGC